MPIKEPEVLLREALLPLLGRRNDPDTRHQVLTALRDQLRSMVASGTVPADLSQAPMLAFRRREAPDQMEVAIGAEQVEDVRREMARFPDRFLP